MKVNAASNCALSTTSRVAWKSCSVSPGKPTITVVRSVAPGISEALVTTAAGLFAAIPAVIAYNQYIQQLKEFGAQMDDFGLEFVNMTERHFT